MAAQWQHQPYQPQNYQQQPHQYRQQQYQAQYQQPQFHSGQYQLQGQQVQPNGQYTQPSQHLQQGPYQQPGQYHRQGAHEQPSQYPQQAGYQQFGHYPQTPQQYQPTQDSRGHQRQHSGYQHSTNPPYPSQTCYPQQQSPSAHGSLAQPYQLQPNLNAAAPQPCFNCGNPSHFAQDCPEPRRAVPAGALDPHKFQNPLRRPKLQQQPSGPPTVTQLAQSYASTSPAQPVPPQYQTQQSHLIPNSAQSPAQQQHNQQQWQQYYQWQANQNVAQSQQWNSQQQPQQQQPQQQQHHAYSAVFNQSPLLIHGPIQASLRGSQQSPRSSISQSQYSHPEYSHRSSATATPIQVNGSQNWNTASDWATDHHQQQSTVLVSAQSESVPTNFQQDQRPDDEPEEIALDALDLPNLPPSPTSFFKNKVTNAVMTPPIRLIAMPLPANFVVADTLYPIASPAPEEHGRCRSKYWRDVDVKNLAQHIRDSRYWDDHKEDPIFTGLPDDETTFPLQELISSMRLRHLDEEARNGLGKYQSPSRCISMKRETVDLTTLDELERSLAEEKAKLAARLAEKERSKLSSTKRPRSPPPKAASEMHRDGQALAADQNSPASSLPDSGVKSEPKTEGLLAALGVTGIPKPVTNPFLLDRNGSQGSPNDNLTEAPRYTQPEPQQSHSSPPDAQGFASLHPPSRQNSHPNAMTLRPLSTSPSQLSGQSFNTNGHEYHGHPNSHVPGGQIQSPTEFRLEKSGSRKRSFARRDSSSEDDVPARRQEDDITPRMKRRQPKVAEAYSRRW